MNPETPRHSPPPPPSDPELIAFLTTPVPRDVVPSKLLREAYAQMALGRLLYISLTCFGSVLVLCVLVLAGFTPFAMLRDAALTKKHEIAPGTVTSVKYVNDYFSRSGGMLLLFEFTFTAPDVGRVAGACYADEKHWEAGGRVTIEYDPSNVAKARIHGARLAKKSPEKNPLPAGLVVALVVVTMLTMGVIGLRKYFAKRAHCRWLIKNGLVDEFLVVDFNVAQQAERQPLLHTYRLKPANREEDRQLYFTQLTKRNQIDYADAVYRSKTTTFGIYDPTVKSGVHHKWLVVIMSVFSRKLRIHLSNLNDKNSQLNATRSHHVLMVEAWFHNC